MSLGPVTDLGIHYRSIDATTGREPNSRNEGGAASVASATLFWSAILPLLIGNGSVARNTGASGNFVLGGTNLASKARFLTRFHSRQFSESLTSCLCS